MVIGEGIFIGIAIGFTSAALINVILTFAARTLRSCIEIEDLKPGIDTAYGDDKSRKENCWGQVEGVEEKKGKGGFFGYHARWTQTGYDSIV